MKAISLRSIARYGFYPFLLAVVVAATYFSVDRHWSNKTVYAWTTVFLLVSMMIYERIFPLDRDGSMTVKSFFRDLKFIPLVGISIGLTKTAFGIFAIAYSENHRGLLSDAPILVGVVVFLLVFEFFQYAFHRFSHSDRGALGRFLWRVHVAHHLPDRVYVVMHAVFHPINAVIITSILQLPLILLGLPPAAVLAATLLIDLQSLISHFNGDIRAGFFNYVLIGAETHRYHHSADAGEAKNFGNTLAIWDILFGTFQYRPGKPPLRLGVQNPELYPSSENLFGVLAWPFIRSKA